MINFKKFFVVLHVLFLFVYSGCSDKQKHDAPQGKVDPEIKTKVEQALNSFAAEMRSKIPDKQAAFEMLKTYLNNNDYIYGSALAFAPKEENGKTIKSSPYVYRSGNALVEKDLIDSYDYTAPEQTWYTVPAQSGKSSWSDPYFDEGGGEAWMITYSIPVFSGEEKASLVGIVTSDVLIPKN